MQREAVRPGAGNGIKERIEGSEMVTETAGAIGTGSAEIDEKLGGGLPLGALVLLEGGSGAGKSLVCQHLSYRALRSRLSLAYYASGGTVKGVMSQMKSLELDVTDYFLCDRLRVYPVAPSEGGGNAGSLEALLAHIEALPAAVRLIIIDSLSGLAAPADGAAVEGFFHGCRRVCGLGRTVLAAVDSSVWDREAVAQAHGRSDAHLRLLVEEMGERRVKALEVTRLGGADLEEGERIGFEIEPGQGLRALPAAGA